MLDLLPPPLADSEQQLQAAAAAAMSATNATAMMQQEVWGQQLFDNLNKFFLIWYLPLILLVGTFGAVFCMLFIFKSQMFPKIIQIWLVSICFGDFMILMWDALRMFTKLAFDYDFRDANTVICKMQAYLGNFFFHWSAYNQAAMSVQRLIFISSPLRSRSLLTTKRVFASWSILTVLLLFPNATYLLHWHIGKRDDCEPTDKWFYYVTTLVHLIVWGIIPLASMTVSTGCISYRLIRYSQNNFKVKATATTNNNNNAHKQQQQQPQPPPQPLGGRRHGGDQSSHVTRLLVSMNLFYLFTTFPLLIYMMYLNFQLGNRVGETIARSLHKFYYYLFRSLCFLNASLNWVFYCAAGKIFRQRAQHILHTLFCRSSRKRASRMRAAAAANNSRNQHYSAASQATTPMLSRSAATATAATTAAAVSTTAADTYCADYQTEQNSADNT